MSVIANSISATTRTSLLAGRWKVSGITSLHVAVVPWQCLLSVSVSLPLPLPLTLSLSVSVSVSFFVPINWNIYMGWTTHTSGMGQQLISLTQALQATPAVAAAGMMREGTRRLMREMRQLSECAWATTAPFVSLIFKSVLLRMSQHLIRTSRSFRARKTSFFGSW